MKITFLSPHIGIGGGVKIIFEYANRLMDLGHDVTVVSIIPKSMRGVTSRKMTFPAVEAGKSSINPIREHIMAIFNRLASFIYNPVIRSIF